MKLINFEGIIIHSFRMQLNSLVLELPSSRSPSSPPWKCHFSVSIREAGRVLCVSLVSKGVDVDDIESLVLQAKR
uniref:Uncharacterized protein n=1 Tax=Rhizophora mucronata TaxID=61149 RepID=A0A2P2MNX9_RHIMU